MWRYVLKRLLLVVPTLLGISVITFCLVRLAPGDPATAALGMEDAGAYGRAVTQRLVESARRFYGLDKPLLLNLDVKDRRRTVLSMWEEARALLMKTGGEDPGPRSAASRERFRELAASLRSLGKRLVPYLVPAALSEENEACRDFLLGVLREGAHIEAAEDRERLATWWASHAERFGREAVAEAVRILEQCSPQDVPGRARRMRDELGELALPEVEARIESLPPSPARRRLITFLAPWAGYDLPLGPEAEPGRFEAALRFIRDWWDREGLAYREIGAWERVWRAFSEAQFPRWLGRILCFDFGRSFTDHRLVVHKIWEALKITLAFQVLVILLIYLIAVPLGVISAVKQDSLFDKTVTLVLFCLYSLPNFWVAYLLILFFCGGRFGDIFPIQGLNTAGAEAWPFWPWFLDRLWHMVLPVACMTYGGLAALSRYARSGMLEVIRMDYVRTARAKGLAERTVIVKHALRNGIIPIVTLLGGLLPALVSGSVIVETIFNIPGMGRLAFSAVLERDYPVVTAVAFFSSFLVLLGILLSDLLYAVVDPRIRYGEEG